MFHRLTHRARRVVVLAQEEARAAGHDQIGTGHILLGLLREQASVAARVLAALDVDAGRVRAQITGAVPSGDPLTSGEIPLAHDAKRALELATREAQALGHNYIGTEHILLGLVGEAESAAGRMLRDGGADPQAIAGEVIRALSAPESRRRAHPDQPLRPPATTADVAPPELLTLASLSDHELREVMSAPQHNARSGARPPWSTAEPGPAARTATAARRTRCRPSPGMRLL